MLFLKDHALVTGNNLEQSILRGMCQNWHIPLKRLSIAYTLSSKVHWQKEKQKSVSLRKHIYHCQ